MPVSARKQLFDLSDDMATKIDIQFYTDSREALLKQPLVQTAAIVNAPPGAVCGLSMALMNE